MLNKWLLVSGLQKSIRRGRVDLAGPITEALWQGERAYLCYRLGVILLEDVGVGDKALTARLMATRLKKASIDAAGGLDFIKDIVEKACLADKDRSSSDAAYAASFLSNPDGWPNDAAIIRGKALNGPWLERVQAMWLLLGGANYKNQNMVFTLEYPAHEKKPGVFKDNQDLFLSVAEQMGGDATFLADALSCTKEPMAIAWPIICDLSDQETHRETIIKNTLTGVVREPSSGLWIPREAVDGHTGEGVRVLQQVLKDPEVASWVKSKNLNDPEMQKAVFKTIQFRMEGQAVDRRCCFPTAIDVMKQTCEISLRKKWPHSPGWLEIGHFWETVAGPKMNAIREGLMSDKVASPKIG